MSNELQTTSQNTAITHITSTSSQTSIKRLQRIEGDEVVNKLLASSIDQLQIYFNLERQMTLPQIEMTIDIIKENFYYFSAEDFSKCFRAAMSGKYGKIYNRIDGAVIMDWLRTYDIERTEKIVQEQMQKNTEQNKEIMSTESFNVAIKKIIDELTAKTKRNQPEPYVSKRTPFENQVIKEYDKLRGTKQFATYNGKQMDFEMYRAVRFQEEMSNQGQV